jgi:hypothetical protein
MKDPARVIRLQQQVKAAWDKLPLPVKAKLGLKITAAHAHALAVKAKTITALQHPPHRELLMLHSLLNDPNAAFAKAATAAPKGLFTHVGPDGQVYFGDVDYDSTDIGWAYCFPAMVLTDGETPPFKVGNVIQIPDTTTLALLGDWGGWNAPAQSIAAAVKSIPYIVHLGDVYYAGTNGGTLLDPYEPDHFTKVWPGVPGRSFALNSNHDMYAHATGYSLTALMAPPFTAQGGNCFALYNAAFRIVGLDTAYYAPDSAIDEFPGYMIGSLGPTEGPQMQFLQSQIGQLTAGQTLILLSHHNGLTENGSLPQETDAAYTLWQQVTQLVKQIPATASKNVVWYYGHVHVGAVYKPQTVGGVTIYPRCCGHSCIPWGIATELQTPNVLWFEQQVLGPGSDYFVTNGYATLALDGASLTEAFRNQTGKPSWTGHIGAVA